MTLNMIKTLFCITLLSQERVYVAMETDSLDMVAKLATKNIELIENIEIVTKNLRVHGLVD